MPCNACGSCCKVLFIEDSPEDIDKLVEEEYPGVKDLWKLDSWSDHAFIKACWNPIAEEEAFKRNPELKNWIFSSKRYFYECIYFEHNKCSIHYKGNKPQVCTEYPFYGEKPSKLHINILFDGCGYIEDLKQEAK